MSEYIEMLHDERQRTFEAARGVIARAHDEHRTDLTADESQTYERATARVKELDGQIRDHQEDAARTAALDAARASVEGIVRPAVDDGPATRGNADRAKGLDRFLRSGDGGATYDVSFADYRVVSHRGETPRVESRDIYGYSTQGSLVTPTYTDGQLYQILTDTGAIFRLAPAIQQTSDGNPRNWPSVNAYGTAVITAEGATIAENDPTLGTVTTSPYKYAWAAQLSTEVVSDAAVDLVAMIADAAAESLAEKYSPHFATGSGSSEPEGYITGATVGVQAAGTCTPTNAIALQMTIGQRYRTNAKFATNSGVLSYWRQLRDGNGGTLGAWLVNPPGAPGQAETMFGVPIVEDPGIANHGSGVKSMCYGDFGRGYLLHQGGPFRFQRSDEFAFAEDLISFRGIWRLDGKVRDSGALAVYQATAD